MRLIVDLELGDLCTFTCFPDGQPHCSFYVDALVPALDTHNIIEVTTRLCSVDDVVNTCIALEALDSILAQHNRSPEVFLNISYMLGARMDRRIAVGQPATLHVLAALINTCKVDGVRVLDPHSPVTLEVLDGASALHPDLFIGEVLAAVRAKRGGEPTVVIPDKGAVPRTRGILSRLNWKGVTATCSKTRDPNTGKLSGFALDEGDVAGKHCLIVDDICDGGATFTGIGALLRNKGAASVELAVTHGIFSKGLELEHIECLYSTDSYRAPKHEGFTVQTSPMGKDVKEYVSAADKKVRLYQWTNILERVLAEGAIPSKP